MYLSVELVQEIVKLLKSLADKTQSRAEHERVQAIIKQLKDKDDDYETTGVQFP